MLTFIKLGGSLITDKEIPFSARKQTIKRLGLEILTFSQANPHHHILIGHGSGSFGHAAAAEFGTISGVRSMREWLGFQSVWWAARQLNQVVCELFIEIGLPIISLPASAAAVTSGRQIKHWLTEPFAMALKEGLLPVVYGDVIFDDILGGTILSTEELFSGLITDLKPDRILLAGKDAGVYRDYPANTDLMRRITPQSYEQERIHVKRSENTDVTGGMAAKVEEMLLIVNNHPDLEIQIFSGDNPGNLQNALSCDDSGTIISSK